jgi:hypothetical protein
MKWFCQKFAFETRLFGRVIGLNMVRKGCGMFIGDKAVFGIESHILEAIHFTFCLST